MLYVGHINEFLPTQQAHVLVIGLEWFAVLRCIINEQ